MWIEIPIMATFVFDLLSRLARALWIEMAVLKNRIDFCGVEARESLVD